MKNVTIHFFFIEYFQVVENALSTYKKECVSQIKNATEMIYSLLQTNEGLKIIEQKFKYYSYIYTSIKLITCLKMST